MGIRPESYLGHKLNDRLRVAELVEVRPFSLLFKGDVLALERVVGSCSVTIYRPTESNDPDDIVSILRGSSRTVNSQYIYGLQQVGVIRQGELSGTVYVTGEPIKTTLSLEIEAGRFLGVEDAEALTSQVSRALLAVYGNHEIHGRLRPYNILRTSDGWRLSGLDLHSLEERLERFTRLPEEPVFLPPENYREGLFGRPVDAWALGITLHLGMSGRIPYRGESEELLEQVLKDPPNIERLPGRAGSVVKALLVQEAGERWEFQRCIDHIERPRGGDFGAAPEVRASGALSPAGGVANGEAAEETAQAAVPRKIDNRPVYLKPTFLTICALCFLLLTYIGYRNARLPDVARENKPPEPLYSIDFSQSQVDPDGRIITQQPQQAAAYSENLGAGNRIEMVQINPGVFEMGSLPNEPYYESDEGPRHRVQVGGLFISRFEITQQQWEAIASLSAVSVDLPLKPSTFVGADRPVEGVTWVQAKEFCARLSRSTGRLYRLPTEAEWEFACRAGTDSPFCFGETINSALANYQATRPYAQEGKGQYRRETIPVGKLGTANYFGLMDVHGNVSEWCEDRFGPYNDKFVIDPTGPKSGNDRVVRGGSWKSYPQQCRSASRQGEHKDYRRNDIGFRVVLPRTVMVPAEQGS